MLDIIYTTQGIVTCLLWIVSEQKLEYGLRMYSNMIEASELTEQSLGVLMVCEFTDYSLLPLGCTINSNL